MLQCTFPRIATIWKKEDNLMGGGGLSAMTLVSHPPLFSLCSIHSGLPLFYGHTGLIPASETLNLLYPPPVMFFSSDVPKACYFLVFLRSLFKLIFLPWTNTHPQTPAPTPPLVYTARFTLHHPCKGLGDPAHTGSRH